MRSRYAVSVQASGRGFAPISVQVECVGETIGEALDAIPEQELMEPEGFDKENLDSVTLRITKLGPAERKRPRRKVR